MIYADPTELRKGSRLPEDVALVAKPLPHLEDLTGADLLLTVHNYPATSEPLLRKHCESGALIQLKRRADLAASISTEDRLRREIYKMRQWCERSWLVITGFPFHVNGRTVIGEIVKRELLKGKMARCTAVGHIGMRYEAVDGAVDAWRYYGGYAKFIPDDSLLSGWLQRQTRLLVAIEEGKVSELPPRSVQRELVDSTKLSWLAALFDNIGRKTATLVYKELERKFGREATLYEAVAYVLSYMATEIPGITAPRIASWRETFGLRYLPENETYPALYETPTTNWRVEDTGELYWRGPATSWHYRQKGYIDKNQVFTVPAMQSLLGLDMEVTYLKNEQEQKVTGLAGWIEVESKFEYLVLLIGEDEERCPIRLDWITNVDLLEDKKDG
jgi:hypothetical protein